jgi:plasmid stabilization system protein ParE
MIVEISAEAERDLEAIGDYIAADNPARALGFIEELRSACLGLASMPRRFPLVARYERDGVRHRTHLDYLIFYKIEPERVVVLHVLHGAMDYASILFPESRD